MENKFSTSFYFRKTYGKWKYLKKRKNVTRIKKS